MEYLKVEAIKLRADGVLEVHTNIKDNLELAKRVSKEKMQQILDPHVGEIHAYINDGDASYNTIRYRGEIVDFTFEDFREFLESKTKIK